MADDVQADISLNIDTSKALSGLKALQSELSALHTQLASLGPTQRAQAAGVQRSLIDNINATGKFAASMTTVKTTAESFTTALEKNKLTMGEYFRYAGGASKSFGKNFAREFATIEKVAIERVKSLQTQYIKLGRDANGAMRAIQVRPLTLDMDNLQTKTAIAAQKQQLLNQLLKQGSTQMLNWGKNTQWAGRQLMVGFTIPLGIFAGKAMQAFSEMEKQIISFKRVYGDLSTSAKETDAMAESIKNLATEFTRYGIAVSDTMEMAAKAAAMGKQGADLLGQVQQASKLAVLGQVEQQQALQTTISLTDTFGTSAEDLGKKINFLNSVENQTALSIEDLTIAIPKAGPVIKQLGGDVEDLAFFLTAMREGGINASEGANALKSGLAAMINPTGKAQKMLQGFGIDLQKIVKTNKGDVKGTVVEFAKALDTLDPLNRAKAIEQLFGKFQFARISTLMKNVASDSSQAATTAQLAQKSSIELATMASREMRKISASPLFKFQKTIQDFQTQLVPIGEAFMKFVTPIVDWVNGVLKAFNSLGDGTKTFIVGFTSVVAGLGPVLLMTFGLVANGFANLIKGFAALKSMFNRVQTSSEILGQETHYMTEEQIKAKAVAASLDQVHGKLIQTFNVEAGSVNKLASAYERAVTASQRLMPTVSSGGGKGSRKSPKKYAEGGIIHGPGTGTSDSIIARVSNREAIIPAKNVAKYPDLVRALIRGNIPGFNGGKDGDVPKKIEPLSKRLKHRAGEAPGWIGRLVRGQVWDTRDQELEIAVEEAKRDGVDLRGDKRLSDTWLSNHASHKTKDFTTVDLGRGIASNIKNWDAPNVSTDIGPINKALQNISADTIEEMLGFGPKSFKKQVYTTFMDNLEQHSRSMRMKPADLKEMADRLFTGQHPETREEFRVMERIMQTATPLAKKGTGWQYRSAGRISGLRANDRRRTSFIETAGSRTLNVKNNEQKNAANVARIQKRQIAILEEATEEEVKALAAVRGNSQSQAEESTKQKGSTRRSTRAKQDTAKADESVAKSAKQIAKDYLARALETRRTNPGRLGRRQKQVLAEYDEKQQIRIAKGRATRERNRSTRQSQSYVVSGVDQYMLDNDPTQRRTSSRTRTQRSPGRFSKIASSAKGGFGSIFSMGSAAQDRRAAGASKFVGRMSGGKLLGAGMGVSIGGNIIGGMVGGKTGEAISSTSDVAGSVLSVAGLFGKQLMPVLAKVVPLFAKFLPVVGWAAAAFELVSFAVNKSTEKERENIQRQTELSSAMKDTTKNFESAAEFFGVTVKDRAYGVKTSEDFVGDSVTNAAIEEFRKTDKFASDFGEISKNLKGKSAKEASMILQNLAIELSKDYAPEQVEVITESIKREAGLTSLDIKFNTLDFSTEESTKESVKTLTEYLQGVQKQTIDKIKPLKSSVVAGVSYSEADLKRFEQNAQATKSSLYALRAAFDDGKIKADQYDEAIKSIGKTILDIKDPDKLAMSLEQLTQAMITDENDRNAVRAIKDKSLAYKVLTASLRNYAKAMTLATQISTTEAKLAKLTSIETPNSDQIAQIKLLTDALTAYGIALDSLNGSRDALGGNEDPPPGNDDPYNTGKDTLNKKQSARQKQAQDGLAYLGILEDEINVKYDKRIEALDRVAELNKEIAASQKDQLDLADALSRGDIAAAARAAQTMRANDTQREFDRQKQAIETARNNEVDSLKVKIDGVWYTKEQLEAKNLYYEKKSASNAISNNTVKFAADGGKISGPGTGTSDDIPAMLSNGEYVVRAKAVKALGVDTLDKINHAEKFGVGGFARKFANGGIINKYAVGGSVSPKTAPTSTNDLIGEGMSIAMDQIWQALLGPFMNNAVRKGKITTPGAEDALALAGIIPFGKPASLAGKVASQVPDILKPSSNIVKDFFRNKAASMVTNKIDPAVAEQMGYSFKLSQFGRSSQLKLIEANHPFAAANAAPMVGHVIWDNLSGEIKMIEVAQARRGQGLGKALFSKAMEQAIETGVALPSRSGAITQFGAGFTNSMEKTFLPGLYNFKKSIGLNAKATIPDLGTGQLMTPAMERSAIAQKVIDLVSGRGTKAEYLAAAAIGAAGPVGFGLTSMAIDANKKKKDKTPAQKEKDLKLRNKIGNITSKFPGLANGGMVGPRQALMADAAERSFKKIKSSRYVPKTAPKSTGDMAGYGMSMAMDQIWNAITGPFTNEALRHGNITTPGVDDAFALAGMIPFGKPASLAGKVAKPLMKPTGNVFKDFLRPKVVDLVTKNINPNLAEEMGFSTKYNTKFIDQNEVALQIFGKSGRDRPSGEIWWDTKTGEISLIEVEKALQGKGLAKSLFSKAMAKALEEGVALPARSSDITSFGAGFTNSLEKTFLPGVYNFKKLLGFDAKATRPDMFSNQRTTAEMKKAKMKQGILDFLSGRKNANKFANGGIVNKYALGGEVGGSGASDLAAARRAIAARNAANESARVKRENQASIKAGNPLAHLVTPEAIAYNKEYSAWYKEQVDRANKETLDELGLTPPKMPGNVDSTQMVGYGMQMGMNGIYQAILGPFINNIRKGKITEFTGRDVQHWTGSPWLAGQYDGKPVDPSGWDALAVAGVLPIGKLGRLLKPAALADGPVQKAIKPKTFLREFADSFSVRKEQRIAAQKDSAIIQRHIDDLASNPADNFYSATDYHETMAGLNAYKRDLYKATSRSSGPIIPNNHQALGFKQLDGLTTDEIRSLGKKYGQNKKNDISGQGAQGNAPFYTFEDIHQFNVMGSNRRTLIQDANPLLNSLANMGIKSKARRSLEGELNMANHGAEWYIPQVGTQPRVVLGGTFNDIRDIFKKDGSIIRDGDYRSQVMNLGFYDNNKIVSGPRRDVTDPKTGLVEPERDLVTQFPKFNWARKILGQEPIRSYGKGLTSFGMYLEKPALFGHTKNKDFFGRSTNIFGADTFGHEAQHVYDNFLEVTGGTLATEYPSMSFMQRQGVREARGSIAQYRISDLKGIANPDFPQYNQVLGAYDGNVSRIIQAYDSSSSRGFNLPWQDRRGHQLGRGWNIGYLAAVKNFERSNPGSVPQSLINSQKNWSTALNTANKGNKGPKDKFDYLNTTTLKEILESNKPRMSPDEYQNAESSLANILSRTTQPKPATVKPLLPNQTKPKLTKGQMIAATIAALGVGGIGAVAAHKLGLFANGGLVSKIKPSYFADGDLARGTDVIPAMLTPGEFVMTRSAVQNFGVDNLRAINSGDVAVAPTGSTSSSDSVYNYSINVNVSSMSDPNDIAKTVMTQIKRIDSQKVRGIYNG